MAVAAERLPQRRVGSASPRLAPPEPIRHMLREFQAAAADLGIELMPWQKLAGKYMTALDPRTVGRPAKLAVDTWKYRDFAAVVSRQNGKSTLILPRVLMGLRRGEAIIHTAQNRRLPRETFKPLSRWIERHPELGWEVRKANGQEEISTPEGGRYTIVAPNTGPRGASADLVILDEVREQHDEDLMDAILPTLTASANPQVIYLSNAGTPESLVLNSLKQRGTNGTEGVCYLEWSARGDRSVDDPDGWIEANPALGYRLTWATLEHFYRVRPRPSFETEHLCRWVVSSRPAFVSLAKWQRAETDADISPLRPMMGMSLATDGSRASAVIAWQDGDGVTCRAIVDVKGEPINVDAFAQDLREKSLKLGVTQVGYGSATDLELAKHFKKSRNIGGREFANASSRFHLLLEQGSLRWDGENVIGEDLPWTTRKPFESGAWEAVKAQDDREITGALAAIRAVWLASGPVLEAPRVL